MNQRELEPGDVVQLAPTTSNPMFACCFMQVTERKPWGAQGFVQMIGENRQPGPQAYYRAEWDHMEYIGKAEWMKE